MHSDRHNHFIGDITQKAIIEDRGRVLVAKTKKGYWEIPGGRLNIGESPREGLRREVREELNLEIRPRMIFDAFTFISVSGMRHFAVIYVCKLAGSHRAIRVNKQELKGFWWVSKDEARKLRMKREYYLVLQKFFQSRERRGPHRQSSPQ